MSIGKIGGAAAAVGVAMAISGGAAAQTCTSYPNNLQNGASADAGQVMADFNCAALTGAGRFTAPVGILNANPDGLLSVGANLNATGPRQTITIGDAGVQAPVGVGSSSYGDKLVLWKTDIKIAVGVEPYSLWLQSTGPGGAIKFYTGAGATPAEAVKIDSAGNLAVGLGGAAQNSKLQVAGDIMLDISSGQRTLWFRNNSSFDGMALTSSITGPNGGLAVVGAGGGTMSAFFDRQGFVGVGTSTPTGKFYVNGQAGGTTNWTVASDERLKKNIARITGALGIVQQLRGVRFDWRPGDERTIGKGLDLPAGKTEIGVVAQEVARVLPEAVAKPQGADGYYGVQEAGLVAVLIEAVKEQQAQMERMQREITALKRTRRR